MQLPPATAPGTKLAAATPFLQERNDLAALLPPPDQSKYPFQSYMVRKPVETGGGGLLADDAADVIVMGNSFMQPAYGFANVVSEQLNRPVALLWKVHQFSPYLQHADFPWQRRLQEAAAEDDRVELRRSRHGDAVEQSRRLGATPPCHRPSFLADLHKALGV